MPRSGVSINKYNDKGLKSCLIEYIRAETKQNLIKLLEPFNCSYSNKPLQFIINYVKSTTFIKRRKKLDLGFNSSGPNLLDFLCINLFIFCA